MSEEGKISVLMVCLGNICRSPMAEAVFRHVAKTEGFESKFSVIDSAGTAGYHIGSSPDSRAQDTCREHGVDIEHEARKISSSDYEKFNYIFAMDRDNMRNLKRIQPSGTKAKVVLFGDYSVNDKGVEVDDPYYGAENGFEINFKQISEFSKNFMKEEFGESKK